ncbi:hypothetical protein FQZ97_714850 [compost metagenome]
MRQVHDGVAHLGAREHLLEGAAARDDEHDAGDGLEAFAQRVAQFLGIAPAQIHQGDGREQDAQQHGHQRVAQEGGGVHRGGILGQQHLGQRMHEHQQRGQQGRQHAQAHAGRAAAFGLLPGRGELIEQGLVRTGRHARRNEGAIQRAAEDHGGQRGDEAVDHGRADRGLEGGDRRQGARVRRHHAVHRRQRGNHRHAHIHIGRPLETLLAFKLARHAEDQRQHHHQAHLEKHRNADDERHQRHGPRNQAGRGMAQDGIGQALRGAGIGQDLPQHGAERDHHAHRAQSLAGAVGQVLDDGRRFHAGGETDADGHDQQRQQWMHADARDDERHQHEDARQGGEQQLDVERRHSRAWKKRAGRRQPAAGRHDENGFYSREAERPVRKGA